MLPGYGFRDGALSSLALDGSPACKLSTAPELERAPSRRSCLMDWGVNPPLYMYIQPNVHTRSPTAPNYMIFGVLVLTW